MREVQYPTAPQQLRILVAHSQRHARPPVEKISSYSRILYESSAGGMIPTVWDQVLQVFLGKNGGDMDLVVLLVAF